MKKIKILHLSSTPLVGAPGKISKFLSIKNFDSEHFYLNDYPEPLKNIFNSNSIYLNNEDEIIMNYFYETVKKANIIHIHNTIAEELCYKLIEINPNCKYVYQVHSPLREPPLFCNNDENLPFRFDAKLCISQVHPRLYPDFTMVPNLIDHQGKLENLNEDKIKVLFSPTHHRNKAEYPFSTKFSPKMDENINLLTKKYPSIINFAILKKVIAPNILIKVRENCHVSIDEIATGGFHQISYEGLACGNVVINNADIFARQSFAESILAEETPPFYQTDDNNFVDNLLRLATDKNFLKQKREDSFKYYQKYMKPQRLINCFIKIYKEII